MLGGRVTPILSEPSGLSGLATSPVDRRRDEAVAPVPREACPASNVEKRRYRSPSLTTKGAHAKQKLIDAALALIAEGDFRPTGKAICARAGVLPSKLTYHFRHVDLLMKIIAREYWQDVLRQSEFVVGGDEREEARFVWLLLVGRRKELS